MKKEKFEIKRRIKSVKNAFRGLYYIIKKEHNFRIHLIVSVFVILLGVAFQLAFIEWTILVLTIGFVIILEIINTSIEKICDFIEPNFNNQIGLIKDISAAVVLISSFISILIGLIIFIPKIEMIFI